MRKWDWALAAAMALPATAAHAGNAHEDAAAFGARPGVEGLALSPDGTKIGFVAPGPGQSATLFTVSVADGDSPKPTLSVAGKPDRLSDCGWVSNDRLVCTIWGYVKAPDTSRPLGYRRKIAVDAGGGHQLMLYTKPLNADSALFDGGKVIDWLAGENGTILMTRQAQRTAKIGTLTGSEREGTALDRVDTRTGQHREVEPPRIDAGDFITDGLGHVRIVGFAPLNRATYQSSSTLHYAYRPASTRELSPLSTYDMLSREGFRPVAVDAKQNLAYGFQKQDGRYALFTKSLDGAGTTKLVYARPDVDVDDLVQIGRDQRIVGLSYATDQRRIVYFDPEVQSVTAALHRALPGAPIIDVVDASVDGTKWLVVARSDTDPGRYYLLDRTTRKLQVLMEVRPELAGRKLGTVQSITYPAADGAAIPAYLTLPPGGPTKGLPAIVLPHGGPSARDEWGFDWLSQFFVARGYAVLQPEFRGSSGYGDAWFRDNGFRNWRVAVGDVADAGRWLVSKGIADPRKLAIFGWSYGGYAALQSAVIAPGLFKAVVAVAPVTDLASMKEEARDWSDHGLVSDFIGQGPQIVEGSPAQNARAIKAPVLLFHGTLDRNVTYPQSTLMQSRLRGAGGTVELVTFEGLDHQLEDSAARTEVLEKSDAFIQAAMGR